MLNHITLMGRIVRDIELRRTNSGKAVASFTVAVDRDFSQGDQKETDFIESVRCCMTIVRTYIDMMKDLGIYDNSTIIVMADHGGDPKTEGGYGQCPGLMIKKKGESHDFRTSLSAVSYSELAEEMASLVDGYDRFEEKTEEITERRFLYYLFNHEDHIEEYVQKGYAWDDSTMELTGRTFDAKK